ncbi:MAG: flagellar rod assembly protein/muramidase FlgJ [Cellvibrio sp. 79]|nr:MAG: flagellar rod assembly protein/muramidase FlgJ [Cellvibrio sp. 79]
MLSVDTGVKTPQVQDTYLDANSLDSVKAMGRARDPQALKEISQKFEAMFVQQMLKTMREANEAFSEGNYFDSNTTRFHRDMLDQQMVLNLTSGRGMGLGEHFYKQMMQSYGSMMKPDGSKLDAANVGNLPAAVTHKKIGADNSAVSSSEVFANDLETLNSWVSDFMRMSDNSDQLMHADEEQGATPPDYTLMSSAYIPALLNKPQMINSRAGQKSSISESQENFVLMLKPHAEKAAAELNISPDVLIAQVALETGWGKHVIHDQKGNNSFNLFNIKAAGGWQGDKVNISTLEYRDGIAANEKADFRKYNDYAQSFSDYVNLMKNSPRYQDALEAGKNSSAYAEALQSAGYATDPHYAKKIKSLLNSDAIRSLGELAQTAQSFISNAATTGRKLVE